MTIPDGADALTEMLRNFMSTARKFMTAEGPDDPLDRALAAIALAAAAALVAWPKGKKAPKVIHSAVAFGRKLWARRSLFWTS